MAKSVPSGNLSPDELEHVYKQIARNIETNHFPGKGSTLPSGFSGAVDRMTKGVVWGTHYALNGRTLCGSDVTVVTQNLWNNHGGWVASRADVNCGRCGASARLPKK